MRGHALASPALRRVEGSRRHDPHRRQFRDYRSSRGGRPRRVRQPQQVHPLDPADQWRRRAHPPHFGHCRAHAAGRPHATALAQHDHRALPRPHARRRAKGAGHHAPPAARSEASAPHARPAHADRTGHPHLDRGRVRTLCVGARCGGQQHRGSAHRRGECDRGGAELLSTELPQPHAVDVRNRRLFQRWLLAGLAVTWRAEVAFTYSPIFNWLFHTAPLRAAAWLYIFAIGVVAFAAVELEKWLRVHKRRATKEADPRLPARTVGSVR